MAAGEARDGDAKLARRLQEDFNNECGIFTTPTVNIISAKHLLDSIEATPDSLKSRSSQPPQCKPTSSILSSRCREPEEELIVAALARKESVTAAPTTGVARRMTATPAADIKSPPYNLCNKLKKDALQPP